ncbi:A24 family peptidase [Phenylobacterium montanum]|uniref:Prepilin peptidase n=1 Tax=Phenylobacterium montanum TaxID=2823693 RepID=A0A975ITD3_9CAUL|nr:prepilin peptidase [Caulobacter sp. S6]QUD86747.1 prepilin peptidase [Caulobacter sp. S6]
MPLFQAILLTIFPAVMIIAALSDATSFTIPNRLSLVLLAGFLPVTLMLGRPLGEIGLDLGVGVAALAAGMAMFAAGWIGGGDAKLFAVAALWLGWPAVASFLIVTALCGGGLAVLLLNARSSFVRSRLAGAPGWVERLVTPGGDVPYGIAIAAGALVAFPHAGIAAGLHGF